MSFSNSQNKLMEQMATLRDLVDQAIQKKEEEKQIAEEQAARDRSLKIPVCYDDDEDHTIACITPFYQIKVPDTQYFVCPAQYETYSCEFSGNDAHYGYDCPPQVLRLQEQEVEEKHELLAEEQAANPSEPSLVSYFYNAACDNISTLSTTYTIHLTKSATIITNPSELTRRIYHNHDIFYDGDDNEELFPDEVKRIQQILERTLFEAITPDFSITDSLKSKDLSKDLSDIESECNVPVCDDFTTVSNPLFDDDNDSSSNPHHFNAESDLIESLLNRDTLIISSPKFDSLLEEFSGELAHIDLISPGINEADFDPEEEIRLVEKLLYDNSSPRPPEEFNSENPNAIIGSFSPSPIPVEDSDSLMEEIDLFLTPDDSMPPGIENDDYDSEGDILFLEELLSNDPLSLPENESFHFDRYYVPSSPRPPEKPPDDDDEPDTGVFTKVVDDISDNSTRELYVHVPNVLPTLPTLSLMFDTLLPFSPENEDKVHLLSHRGFKAFQVISDFFESPMMIYGEDIPILDVQFLHFYPP
ncbi:hypothetical protein Tco_0625941 [Tanacetum coccineum]|uniref:Chitin-binding type-2 domain-containing protein n=1 Tax=Tanacetum coccineum TaxID=301880 RepID=A0ABQ4WI87_9ASTR